MKTLLVFGILIATCSARLKCGTGISAVCPSQISPCPAVAICAKGSTLVKAGSGCCCQSKTVTTPTKPPATCGMNEVQTTCAQPISCQPTCDDPKRPPCPTLVCSKGCHCKPGYIRGDRNQCVPEVTCGKPKCGKGEVVDTCAQPLSCQPTCSEPNKPACIQKRCLAGCVCAPGFIRTDNGVCVQETKCPKPNTCKMNEIFNECGSACPEPVCGKPQSKMMCPAVCVPGCFCKDGFIRDANKQCISRTDCIKPNPPGPTDCAVHEQFLGCGPHLSCVATCAKPSGAGPCPDSCRQGCYCADGYVKNDSGKCVLPTDCAGTKCPANESYEACRKGCGDATCRDPTNATVRCSSACKTGCFCNQGYVRQSGKCVKVDQCPKATPTCSGKNKQWMNCGPFCGDTTCKVPFHKDCKNSTCVQGCFCKSGFVKDENDTCVELMSCPKLCRTNEVFSQCGGRCENTCKNPDPANLACPKICFKGCICEPGFVRNNGVCTPADECPVGDCSENEEYVSNKNPCEPTCSEPERQPCPTFAPTPPGCACKKGFVRDTTGKCINKKICTTPCGINQTFDICGNPCAESNCNNVNMPHMCASVCKAGCYCNRGTVRLSAQECQPVAQCPAKPKSAARPPMLGARPPMLGARPPVSIVSMTAV